MDKIFYFPDDCAEQYKNHKNFIGLSHHLQDFNMYADWIFFATSHGKSPYNVVGGFAKRYVVKHSLQRPLHDQNLSYKSMIDLCVGEIPSITYFGVSQEEMFNVFADLEDRFARSFAKTVPGTKSRHHFVPILATKLLTNSQVMIEKFFNLISTNHSPKKHLSVADKCFVPASNILCVITATTTITDEYIGSQTLTLNKL